jgi:NADH-quinone oxidoreductase subunit M
MIMFIRRENVNLIKWIANITGVLCFLVSIPLMTAFNNPQYIDAASRFRFVYERPWIPLIGANYKLGIDGISLLLVLLTTLLGAISILSSWTAITERVKEYYAFMLLLQTGMIGVFISLDLLVFYVFWEVMLVPMYFLIGVWGGPRKLYAAIKFFLYTLAGSVLMLVAILAMYFYQFNTTGVYSFDILKFQKLGFPTDLQFWVFLAFFIGFAIKVPMFPFHTWLPDAHVEAPTAGSVILAGVLLKMGTYGFVRFSLPMFPWATMHFLKPMLIICLIGIIYGALVAMMQKDMKSLVAYSSVSHLGFVMMGVFAATPVALQGGVLQMVNHGISTGALFLIVGVIYERRHTRLISDYGGLSHIMPVYATVFLIMTLSSIGMPGLNGFIGEFFILQGTFAAPGLWIYAALAVLGIVLGAAYMLWMYQRVMFGKLENPLNKAMPDLNMRELATFVPLIILAFWIGIYPSFFTKYLDEPVNAIVARVRTDYFNANRAQAPAPPPMPQAADAK